MANTIIGRVLATEKNPTTIDNFTFWTDPELILNPFDIVKVQHVNNSFSYGVIEDIAHITDAASFLTNFISSDFGDVNAEENTLRVGMNYVTAKVVCNTENIYIPLQSNAKVMLATAEEINYALGLNDIRNPLVCGYLEMYEGTKDEGETRIGDALKYIKKNEVHVIDIAKLSEDKQAYVFGDAIRTIYDLQLGQYAGEEGVNPPSRVVIFIDELNKYASKETPKNSPILRQVLDVAERGRSLGVVLFAAEQFRSAIHDRVTGNCSTHAYGRTNSIEVTKSDYKSIPSVYKTMMTRLKQGEYIIQNPIFRSLLNIKFPKPIYKQFK